MYHRFHAPHDCRVEQVTYISGDTWNVNPIALKRVEQLFCKNERAVLRTRLAAGGHVVTLVPVAAILVASIRLHFLDVLLRPASIAARTSSPATRRFAKGEEMGWFEHGSTIIVFAPDGFALCDGVREGATHPHGPAADAAAVSFAIVAAMKGRQFGFVLMLALAPAVRRQRNRQGSAATRSAAITAARFRNSRSPCGPAIAPAWSPARRTG